jgi:amino acid transporter
VRNSSQSSLDIAGLPPLGLQDLQSRDIYLPGWHYGFNIPAFIIVLLLTVLLVRGIRESIEVNNVMVLMKIGAILVFLFFGISFIHPAYYHPFAPNGWPGVLTGGSIIFFTYIGFDSVSTASEECKRPQRDMPIAIIATLVICTLLYVGVAVVLTGIVPWASMSGDAAPVVNALKKLSLMPGGQRLYWIRLVILLGALIGMVSAILVFQLGQARIWFAMSRDRLLPDCFSKVHPQFRTPAVATWVAGLLVAIPSGLFDIGLLAELSNIGTLFAFVLVSIGVLVLRYRDPGRRRLPCSPRSGDSDPECALLPSSDGRPALLVRGFASSAGSPLVLLFTSPTAVNPVSSGLFARPFSSLICYSVLSWNTIFPPRTVMTTLVDRICSGDARWSMSCDRTTISASLPSMIVPLLASSCEAKAGLAVYASIASRTVSACSGCQGTPPPTGMRVTA